MKIMHILSSRIYTGAEVVASQIIHAFSDRAELVYCSPESEEVSQILEAQGIRHVAIKKMNPWELGRVIRREQPDLIHAHDRRASLFSAMSCGRIPVLFHIHNCFPDAEVISLQSIALALAARKAKHIFWVSPPALNRYRFRRLVAGKSSVLCNVVDAAAIARKVESDPARYDYDIVFCGRLTEQKNPLRLIRVCAEVKKEIPSLKVAMVGAGELEGDCRALVQALDLEEHVRFLGYRTNPMKIMHDARLLALTSLWEGLGLVVLEAMAVGTPAVCTDVDGFHDVLLDGKTGFYGRTDAELAEHMVRILKDPALRETLSAGAKAYFAAINDVESYNRTLADYYGL